MTCSYCCYLPICITKRLNLTFKTKKKEEKTKNLFINQEVTAVSTVFSYFSHKLIFSFVCNSVCICSLFVFVVIDVLFCFCFSFYFYLLFLLLVFFCFFFFCCCFFFFFLSFFCALFFHIYFFFSLCEKHPLKILPIVLYLQNRKFREFSGSIRFVSSL